MTVVLATPIKHCLSWKPNLAANVLSLLSSINAERHRLFFSLSSIKTVDNSDYSEADMQESMEACAARLLLLWQSVQPRVTC